MRVVGRPGFEGHAAVSPGEGPDEGPDGPPVREQGAPTWRTARGHLSLDGPLVMGILNLTPDSFSDGGELRGPGAALRRGEAMVREGAAILDVGGESTRPGAGEVPLAEELTRVIPVIEALVREFELPVSVDTRKAGVAERALDVGAAIVNDVSGGVHDPRILEVAARGGAGLVLMHMRGTPSTMRDHAHYDDVVAEVVSELREATARASEAGVAREAIVLDPGIGFAKTAAQSLELLSGLDLLGSEGFPLMVGLSRKSFLGEVLGVAAPGRVTGSAVAAVLARQRGAVIFRVHDVQETVHALRVFEAVDNAGRERSR